MNRRLGRPPIAAPQGIVKAPIPSPIFRISNLQQSILSWFEDPVPPFAITLGDPAGIGPEIVLKALAALPRRRRADWRVYADPWMLETWAEALGLALPALAHTPLFISPPLKRGRKKAGVPSAFQDAAFSAQIAWRSLEYAARDLNHGTLKGVATAPISKARLEAIGFPYPGHTEFFAAKSRAKTVRMMFVGEPLVVALDSIHIPLKRVAPLLSTRHLEETIRLTQDALSHFAGIRSPKLALCGLNPHAGEAGLIGDEEERIIKPLVKRLKGLSGPFPADAYFGTRAYRRYDATIALYHDQGLIPFKLLAFDKGVNCTIGLPYLRTSPDHGCAFDIAGLGKASPKSLTAAMELLEKWSKKRCERGDSNPQGLAPTRS